MLLLCNAFCRTGPSQSNKDVDVVPQGLFSRSRLCKCCMPEGSNHPLIYLTAAATVARQQQRNLSTWGGQLNQMLSLKMKRPQLA